MSFAHCYTEAVFLIFDVYELKISRILTVLSFYMYCKCIPTVNCLSAMFLSCTNMSFSDCKSKCGVLKSIENLENTEEHKAKEIKVASRIPGDACFLCFIVFC